MQGAVSIELKLLRQLLQALGPTRRWKIKEIVTRQMV